jgi:hypothetical protein
MTTKLAPGEISDLDPYKFMAVMGEQVIHLGGRASTGALLARAQITASDRVLDVGCGVPAYTRKTAWLMPRMAKPSPASATSSSPAPSPYKRIAAGQPTMPRGTRPSRSRSPARESWRRYHRCTTACGHRALSGRRNG